MKLHDGTTLRSGWGSHADPISLIISVQNIAGASPAWYYEEQS